MVLPVSVAPPLQHVLLLFMQFAVEGMSSTQHATLSDMDASVIHWFISKHEEAIGVHLLELEDSVRCSPIIVVDVLVVAVSSLIPILAGL